MTESMVDLIARALLRQACDATPRHTTAIHPIAWGELPERTKEHWRDKGRAVIAALEAAGYVLVPPSEGKVT
jgi:hypothetical protein